MKFLYSRHMTNSPQMWTEGIVRNILSSVLIKLHDVVADRSECCAINGFKGISATNEVPSSKQQDNWPELRHGTISPLKLYLYSE
jgi:hypothetical protein